ncbi:NAD(P)-dependent oxidoreductase [Aldersonia sp. NBC_00410]|uniref:NAD-dependent epimerase/dehydratase family protein n=1 Tax=Aldersonia sp. NBC_00410 TaxID=2975954 RepID=UPI0022544062|nr:NAD(P)-dependent oxidoreductase [Aldersonia sp. NBC_00410]MCX5042960.1 NAD(P)-dependent oxidoreductase [Aldersonia sp. NBC_00410]
MKVFVAGATGALGRPLIAELVERGHEVTGMTRTAAKQDLLRKLGAGPVVADALDPGAVMRAVSDAEPDVIVHELTAIGAFNPRRMESGFALTNRLRTEGTDHLLAAGREVGVKRFVAQSFAPLAYLRTGGMIKTEDDPLDSAPPATIRTSNAAIRHLEAVVAGADWTEGITLRYGGFYGPGTSMGLDPLGDMAEAIRKRRMPLAGKGTGVWSFVHVVDAASATAEAIEQGSRGAYNVVDDEPAPVSEWLPFLANALGAKPPLHVPLWLARIAGGEAAAVMMSELRGSSNAKAKRELGWQLRYPSWREGFVHGLR